MLIRLPITKKLQNSFVGELFPISLKRRLHFILLIVAGLQANASVYSQTISLKSDQMALTEVFTVIKKQTGYAVLCKDELLKEAQPVTVNVADMPLIKFLNIVFDPQPFDYQITEKNIILQYKKRFLLKQGIVLPKSLPVTGTVVDNNGNQLPGVTIMIKGSKKGTTTSASGGFAMNVSDGDVLEISSVGYVTVLVQLNKDSFMMMGDGATGRIINAVPAKLKIQLARSISQLDDIVVIGYGSVQKRDVTGSVAKVNINDMSKAPVRSFEEALAGRVAGVQAFSNDGQPGASYNIVIRGNNSITQDNSPLFVVDGFPMEGADNNSINPDDIESIEILKDASSTAIYGARGSNGVIIITTKKGKANIPVISYDGYAGIQNITKRMNLMSPYEFVKFQYEIDSVKTNALYLAPDNLSLDDYKNIKGIDWQNELFRKGASQSHYLSVSGGTGKGRYSISGSVFGQDGVIIKSDFKRYQGRVVVDQEIRKRLKIGVNANYSASITNGVVPALLDNNASQSSYNLLYNVWSYRPVSGLDNSGLIDLFIDPSNENPASDYRINPLQSARNEYRRVLTSTLYANGYGEYQITPDLKLRITGGFNSYLVKRDIFNNSKTRSGSDILTGLNSVNGSITNIYKYDYLNENILTYSHKFNKDNILNLLGGVTIQKNNSGTNGSAATAIPNESLGIDGLDEGMPVVVPSSSSSFSLLSFLARVNYNFRNRYLFTASIRSDASSKFAPSNRWNYFPSGAFAWKLSEEPFMKNIRVLSNAKLRASYGVTGNNRVSDFAYLSTIIYPVTKYTFNNAVVSTSQPGLLGNPDLIWESTSQIDLGLEFGILRDRVNFTMDYYRKNTYDLLINSNLPATSGFVSAFKNVGKVSNEGLEFTLSTVNVSNTVFKWTTDINISFNRNRVRELAENQESITTAVAWDNNYKQTPMYIAKIGQPIAQFYGFIWDGNYQYRDFEKLPNGSYLLKDDVPNNGNVRTLIKPGDIKYKDLNGDGIVNSLDVTAIGNPYPVHVGGCSNNFSYKGFDLNVFFQWSYGNEIYNANRVILEGNSMPGLNQFATYNSRWTPENQNNVYYRFGGQGPYVNSSRVVENGSFLRLKTVSLGYDLPAKLLKNIKIQSLRIYSSAQNLVTWTKYSGMDPEVSTRQSALTPGFDYSPYPRALTVIFGVKIAL